MASPPPEKPLGAAVRLSLFWSSSLSAVVSGRYRLPLLSSSVRSLHLPALPVFLQVLVPSSSSSSSGSGSVRITWLLSVQPSSSPSLHLEFSTLRQPPTFALYPAVFQRDSPVHLWAGIDSICLWLYYEASCFKIYKCIYTPLYRKGIYNISAKIHLKCICTFSPT